MCKVCTEAVHCVALWTRVTLGLGMCKVCTEAVHCVSSPLQAFWRWSPLQAPLKPPSSHLQGEAPFKPPSSHLQGEAPFKPPSSHLQGEAPFKPPWSPLEAFFKPPSSPFEAPFSAEGFKPPWNPLEAPLKPPSSPLEAPLKPSEGEAPFKPSWRVPSKGASLKVKPPSSLKGALPEGRRNLPENVWVDSKVGFLHALFRFACTSHTVSPKPGLVKLLPLQLSGICTLWPVFQDFSASVVWRYVIPYVIGALFCWLNAPLVTGISYPMTSLRRFSFLFSGTALSSLTHSFSEGSFIFEFVWLIRFIGLANDRECLLLLRTEIVLSRCCSWLKGEPSEHVS